MIRYDHQQRSDGDDGSAGAAAAAPGKRTLTQGLAPRGAPRSESASRGDLQDRTATPALAPADDPFGLHLLTGRPGDVPHRADLEPMFGQSFADVQATTGDRSLAARGIRGAADGSSVRFADANPARDVVAHELTHIAQQRQAGAAGLALLDESQPTDAAEVEARAIGDQVRAGDLSPVTVRARPSAAVHFNRDTDERAEELREKSQRDDWKLSALAYFDHNLRHILLLARQQIAAETWPLNHPRVQWLAEPAAIAAALTSRLVELAGGDTADRMDHFAPFWHPVDLWAVIDTNRPLTSGTPGEYAKGKPTAKGAMRRDTMANTAVAIELVAALRASFARMVPRFVAAADDSRPEHADAGQVVTSAPIDRLWARVLADRELVRHTPPTGAAGEATTPTGPGVFRGGLRPVEYVWMGSQDQRMWNVVRVTSPADATAEEVAAQLYQYPGVPAVQSHNAFAIVNAAPFFVLPKTWAKDFPDAVKWASAEHAGAKDEPIDAVLQSSVVDQAAVAQGADEAAHPLAHKRRAGHADTERLTALLWRSADQLAFVADALTPWKLAPQIVAERAWVQRRAMELVNESPEKIATWAPVIEGQQRTITTAAVATLEIVDAARAAAVEPAQPKAGPFRRTLAAYAAALATSHLADLARQRMASADSERQQLALVFVDGALAEAATATEELRETEAGDYGPGSEAAELTRARKGIQRQKLGMREKMLDGQAADPDALENLTTSAGMVTVRSRSLELARKASALSSMLTRTQDATIINSIAAAFDSRFDSLPAKLDALAGDCYRLDAELGHGDDAEFGAYQIAHVPDPAGESEELHARRVALRAQQQARRRGALTRAQQALAAIPTRYGLDRLQREALDAVSDNQIATLAINVVVLIAASIATSGVAAVAGGAARGVAIARLGMSMERAAVVGTAVNVGVDSVLTATIQAGINGDDLIKGTAENVLANVGVRAVLARFAPLMAGLDEEAAAIWTSGGAAAKGGVVIAKGAAVGAEVISAAGVAYVSQRLVRGAPPPSDDQAAAWFIQGASMAIGHMVATRTTQLQARLDRLGARAGAAIPTNHRQLLGRVRKQARLAGQVTDSGGADEAMRLLIENRALLDEEAQLLGKVGADPAVVGLSSKELAGLAHDNASARADTAAQGMDVLPLRLAGVDEVIPGALWRGSSEQIATAIHQARAVGLTVHVDEVGNRSKRWNIRIGDNDRALAIEETTPAAVAGQHARRPRAAGVAPEARALLKAKAAAELKAIAPTVAATDNASRGYLVTREEGRRMVELFHDIDDAETIEYKAGLLVRIHDADGGQLREWYFEFRDDAHANASAATRAPATDAEHGLPAPNVATVEIYGYLGAKEINGRKLADMSPEEVEAVKAEANEESPLLLAGHVAVSFDGGKTLYGFTPKPDPSLSVEEVIDMLKAGAVFPGQVQIDTKHYEIAAKKAAEQGWKIEQKRVVVTFDPGEQPALARCATDEMAASQRDEHAHGYKFPPRDLSAPRDTVATNGQPIAGECIGNCATWPKFVGVPLPETSGRMTEYMRELDKWADADAPIPGHAPKSEGTEP